MSTLRCPADTGEPKGEAAEGVDALSGGRQPGPGDNIPRTVTSVESCH